ncbi:thioesterase family protein [uncultured Sulfitobacter sp.]|uniref:acyl-CoA thioesterase n=1 Tax=uncultured Sulfitobacter sp. TaxID=191468 RepID=UPI0026376D00|nr:thioesterase family protein [uncultured Sulfitobacter sp.]
MAFLHPQKILFRHCDPAGIVFYPRYFEMINDTVEAFFDQVLSFPFSAMHQTSGIPTVGIEATFTAPSRLGDDLEIALTCTRLGRTSLGLAYDARCGGEQRFAATSTVVFINDKGQSQPWPSDVQAKLAQETGGDA